MDINFVDSDSVPQPRNKVRIERFTATPYPDGWRVRLAIEVTVFQERPNLEINVASVDGRQIAQLSVIETMHHSMEFTVHIRGVSSPEGSYICRAVLYYDSLEAPIDQAEAPFEVSLKK